MFGRRSPPEPEEVDPDDLPADSLHKTRIPVDVQAFRSTASSSGTETPQDQNEADGVDFELEEPPPFHIIHVPRIVLCCLAAVGLVFGLRQLHSHQMQRMPDLLLERSQAARERGDLATAATQLGHYVELVPTDDDVRTEHAALLLKSAASRQELSRAVETANAVLERNPQQHELRRLSVDAAVRTEQFHDAAVHLKSLLAISPAESELWTLLAQTQSETDQWLEAVAAYHMVIRLTPEKIETYIRLADLLDRQLDQPHAARTVLSRMLAANSDSQAARQAFEDYKQQRVRTDPIEIVPRSSYPAYRKIVETLDQNNRDDDPADRLRLKAKELADKTDRTARREAIAILERLRTQGASTPAEDGLLARLYVAHGDWIRGRVALRERLAAGAQNADELAFAIRAFLDQQETGHDVEEWLAQLQSLEPGSFRTAELQARLRIAGGQIDEALQLLNKAFGAGENSAQRRRRVISLLRTEARRLAKSERSADGETLLEQAERYCRGHVAEFPEELVLLIDFFTDAKRVDEALELFEDAWKQCPPADVAAATVKLLQSGQANSEQADKLWKLLSRAATGEDASRTLLLQMARAADVQGDYEAAIPLYRAGLGQDGEDADGQAQLAYLLAMHEGNSNEALRLVKRAIVLHGATAELLEMQGVVQSRHGEWEKGLEDLASAIAMQPTPEVYFHLSQVYASAEDNAAALAATEWAITEGLTSEQVHPLERGAFRELESQLSQVDAGASADGAEE